MVGGLQLFHMRETSLILILNVTSGQKSSELEFCDIGVGKGDLAKWYRLPVRLANLLPDQDKEG